MGLLPLQWGMTAFHPQKHHPAEPDYQKPWPRGFPRPRSSLQIKGLGLRKTTKKIVVTSATLDNPQRAEALLGQCVHQILGKVRLLNFE
jgi:hypothetical protein